MSEQTDIAAQKEEQREELEVASGPAVSDFDSEPADESKHPEFRAHTKRKDEMNAAKFKPIYKVDDNVYLKGARALKGPYSIAKLNSDGTYGLNDESGKFFKDKVYERDLKPV